MTRRRTCVARATALATIGSLVLVGAADARGGPAGNLGNGLGRLLAPPAAKGGIRLDQSVLAIRDKAGRVLVDVYADDNSALATVRQRSEANGLDVVDQSAEHKILEGFVAVSDVKSLAATPGVSSVSQALKPFTRVGKATSQGVEAQRVDRVPPGIDGRGITIGALSDSFDTATETIAGDPLKVHAADDVRTGDLPGPGNPVNSRPVVVIQDGTSDDTDEGRAMLQIAHDVAPKAKLCFATADGGLINFANNVRRLADKSGGCGADVVVDDVIYFDEPMFSDSVMSDAIDAVAAKGTDYFTSAGNEGEQEAWDSKVRLLRGARATAAAKRAGLDLSGVDPSLYDGGLQDMKPGRGTDVAQDATVGPRGGLMDFQWNDPVDLNGTKFGDSLFSDKGELTAAQPEQSFQFTASAAPVGKQVQFRTDTTRSGTTDLILSDHAPEGRKVGNIDTGSSPEV